MKELHQLEIHFEVEHAVLTAGEDLRMLLFTDCAGAYL